MHNKLLYFLVYIKDDVFNACFEHDFYYYFK